MLLKSDIKTLMATSCSMRMLVENILCIKSSCKVKDAGIFLSKCLFYDCLTDCCEPSSFISTQQNVTDEHEEYAKKHLHFLFISSIKTMNCFITGRYKDVKEGSMYDYKNELIHTVL